MNRRNKQINQGWQTRVNELLPMINKLHHLHADLNVNKFQLLVSRMVANHGEVYTINRLKAMRLVLQQYALKQTVTPVPFCKADKDGFPKAIRFLKPALDDVYSIRYSFSVMRIIESFRCEPEYSVSTITDESTADESLMEEIVSYIRNWSFIGKIPKLRPTPLILSNKAGPNGPATITAMCDLTALRQHEPDLLESIDKLLEITSPSVYPAQYQSVEGSFQASKLVLLSDKACKTRFIAIADWWTNTALSSIHKSAMDALRLLPGDVTYRQNEIPKFIKNLGNHLFSSDMTAFTDRFPRKLETCLLEAAYGEQISRLWEQVTCNRTFHHPKGGVRYNCGNPMGLLSSWPVSTLTHHAVKQFCADKVNKKNYKYLILGDDTLDTSKEVYQEYIKTINALGVSVSHAKCTQSEIGNTEFAKRLFVDRVEVTGLPVHILEDAYTKSEQLLEFVRICRERGYEDSFLGPSLDLFLKTHNKGKEIADMLSLPESVSGQPPLLEVRKDSWASMLMEVPEERLLDMVRIARDHVFWTLTFGLNQPKTPKKVCEVTVEPNHPLSFALGEQMMDYLPLGGDEFSIYNSWIDGDYREMVNIPSLDVYRYYNKGHKVTKCKYDVLKTLLRLASGDNNIPLYKPTKLSNFELYDLVFKAAQEESLRS